MRDRLALIFIRLARRLTTWGFTDDYLSDAEDEQRKWLEELREENHKENCGDN